MRRIFSDWSWDERALVAGPLALWIAAFLLWSIVLMVRGGRMRGPMAAARQLGMGWKVSFVAVAAWLVGWALWLTVAR
jgi:hypothetical protein